MNRNNVFVWKADAGVGSRDGRVVPFFDPAQINSSKCLRRKTQIGVYTRKVVDWNDRPKYRGKLDNLKVEGPQQLIIERHIGRAEINSPGTKLLDAPTRTDRRVVDLHVWMKVVVFGKPLRINRISKR